MKVALYARVSTKDKGQEVENQLRQLRAFCRKQGWIVYRSYIDRKSGASADRAALNRLFAASYQRKFDLVLFWALDRFSREGVLETLQYLERLNSYGAAWRSYTDFTTPGR